MSDARLFPEDLVARKFQQRSHILHRRRLEKISATPTDRIDNRSLSSTARPIRRNYNKLGRHYIVTEVKILEENKKLINRIAEIAHSNTKRSQSSMALSPARTTYKINRDKEIGRIYHENLIFAKKLKDLTSTLNLKSHEHDYKLSREYVKLKSHPHLASSLRRSLITPSMSNTSVLSTSRRKLMEIPMQGSMIA